MHEFKHREPFPCPPAEAFRSTTSDFEGIEKFTPNVTSVKVTSHETLPDGRERWRLRFSGEGAIPAIARPLINPQLVCWEQELVCNPANLSVEWNVRPDRFGEHFHCGGVTSTLRTPSGSEIVINGKIEINPPHLPGVPDTVVRAAIEAIEPFIVKIGIFNLSRFYKAIKRKMK
jgi:hypothetical protein